MAWEVGISRTRHGSLAAVVQLGSWIADASVDPGAASAGRCSNPAAITCRDDGAGAPPVTTSLSWGSSGFPAVIADLFIPQLISGFPLGCKEPCP